jgi:beta-glucosidase
MLNRQAYPSSRRLFLAMAAAGLGMFASNVVAAPRISSRKSEADRDRVDALIARMTIQEKAGQLNLLGDPFRFRPMNVNPLDGQGDPARVTRMIREGLVGNLFNGAGNPVAPFRSDKPPVAWDR